MPPYDDPFKGLVRYRATIIFDINSRVDVVALERAKLAFFERPT